MWTLGSDPHEFVFPSRFLKVALAVPLCYSDHQGPLPTCLGTPVRCPLESTKYAHLQDRPGRVPGPQLPWGGADRGRLILHVASHGLQCAVPADFPAHGQVNGTLSMLPPRHAG